MALRDIVDGMEQALRVRSDGAFRQAGGLLGEEKSALREQIQAQTGPEVAAIIRKLRAEQDLTAAELALVRLWVIGDAEGYVAAENDFGHWLEEYARLRDVLAGYAGRDLGAHDLVAVQGLLEDAVRVSFDIANFLEKKERIENFEATTRDPTRINRSVLAALLSRKLESEDV